MVDFNFDINATATTQTSPWDFSVQQGLTPDALMAYCESRLRGLDTQIQQAFCGQTMANHDGECLSNLSNTLQTPSGDLDLNTADGYKAAWDAYSNMISTANAIQDPGTRANLLKAASTLHDKLTSAFNNMVGGGTWKDPPFQSDGDIDAFFNGGGFTLHEVDSNGNQMSQMETLSRTQDAKVTVTTQEWADDVSTAVKNVSQNLNTQAELAMISLQALMSQRQEAIQLTTNLVQSLGDQCNKIAENVGH